MLRACSRKQVWQPAIHPGVSMHQVIVSWLSTLFILAVMAPVTIGSRKVIIVHAAGMTGRISAGVASTAPLRLPAA
jgi:hypothetical protein